MGHPNEDRLREAYAVFATGDMEGFLSYCADDVTFTVPGNTSVTGRYTRSTFSDLIDTVMRVSAGTFREDVVDVFGNDEHALVLLLHRLERDGVPVEYRTAHIVELVDGKIATWREFPGDERAFDEAWR